MNDNVKRIDIKEFRAKGYLQELNRRFLHPLGLALEVIIGEDGTEILGGIWDYREDNEGIYYAIADKKATSEERLNSFIEKAKFIEDEIEKRKILRTKSLGFFIEPLERDKE